MKSYKYQETSQQTDQKQIEQWLTAVTDEVVKAGAQLISEAFPINLNHSSLHDHE